MVSFGERLRLLREERNLTQIDLAKILSVANSTISQYEANRRNPDSNTLQRLAEYFGVSVDYLLCRVNIRSAPDLAYFEEALAQNKELLSFWQELKQREDLQILFKQARELKPESVRKIVEVIKMIEDKEADDS